MDLLRLILIDIHQILSKVIHLKKETWFQVVCNMLKLCIVPIIYEKTLYDMPSHPIEMQR